ncbi:MAG TPA: alpha/beta hydrolase [Burkholderiales bacterium]|jgi:acetyl esterase/lipase|nr:alpha/beta hydrolase [Burkholderiales bacterium]
MENSFNSRRAAGVRPEALTRFLRDLGPRWQSNIRDASDATKAAYLPHLAAAPKEGVEVTRDIAYAPHPRCTLDVYRSTGAQNAPVMMFVHGGAFVRGDKNINAEMYGNVLTWFARRGCVGINVEYRQPPEAVYPEGGRDIAAACAWVKQSIAGFGGDPRRVCLIGHSAGGTHAATYAFDPRLGDFGRDIAALVLMSARLRVDAGPENPNAAGVQAYFGTDESQYEARSPVSHAADSKLPMFIICAQYENPLLDLYSMELAHRVAMARRVAPRFLSVADHNHMSLVAHFNTGEEFVGEEILDFCATAFAAR